MYVCSAQYGGFLSFIIIFNVITFYPGGKYYTYNFAVSWDILLVSKISDLLGFYSAHMVVSYRSFAKTYHPSSNSQAVWNCYCLTVQLRVCLFVNNLRAVWRRVCKIEKSDYYHRHVCLSDYAHGTTQLPLDGFKWNLEFEYFSKIFMENSV